jgi:hypothetical protein
MASAAFRRPGSAITQSANRHLASATSAMIDTSDGKLPNGE